MRLQLALVLLAPALASAQDAERSSWEGDVTSKLSLYADDDDTSVVTTLVDGDVRLPVPITVGGHFLVDAVSSASVDVVSAATGRWSENRYEGGARLRASIRDVSVGFSAQRSTENDWRSTSAQLALGREFAQKNTSVQIAYGVTDNDVGRAEDPNFSRDLDAHTIEAGVTQLLDRRTWVSATYTLQHATGFQSSPYRYVFVSDGTAMPESHPTKRLRQALTLRLRRALGESMAGDLSYRLYTDDWGVLSHTAAMALDMDLSSQWNLRLRARGYYQSSAEFYRARYEMPMAYMSADRELGNFWDINAGAKLAWSSRSGKWIVDAKAEGLLYRFLNFAALEGRVALVSALGVQRRW